MIRMLLASTALLGSITLTSSAQAAGPMPIVKGAAAPTGNSKTLKAVPHVEKGAVVPQVKIGEASTTAASKAAKEVVAPQFKIGGQTSFNSWFFNNDSTLLAGNVTDSPWLRKGNGRGQYFNMDDSRIRLSIDGRTDLGMEYGLLFVLDGDVGAGNTLREDYFFFGGGWGKLFVGDTYGVQKTMTFGGCDNWGATGFVDGPMPSHTLTTTTGAIVSDELVGDTSRSTKITYQTPRWQGLQLGVSYTPRGDHVGSGAPNSLASSATPVKVPFDSDNVATTLNFMHQFTNGFELGLSGNSIFARSNPEYAGAPQRKSVSSFAFGGKISYMGIGFSTQYGNNGKSRQLVGQNISDAGQFLSYALSYTRGATRVSTGYYYSWRNALGGGVTTNFTKAKATTNAVSAAIDHKLAPGLALYFEYANFQMKNPAAQDEAARINTLLAPSGQYVSPVKSNKNNTFVLGSRLVF